MKTVLLAILAALNVGYVAAQSQAGQNRANLKFGENTAQVKSEAPWKYNTQVLYFSESWMVSDSGMLRKPSESEISHINIEQYESQRKTSERVVVEIPSDGMQIVLLSMDEFVQSIRAQLPPEVMQAYEQNKSNGNTNQTLKGE